jgi:hypothetical protein
VGALWHLYNVHGNFEQLQAHSEVLLRRASLWDEHGARGWPGRDGRIFSANAASHRSDYNAPRGGSAAAAAPAATNPAAASPAAARASMASRAAAGRRRRRLQGVNGAAAAAAAAAAASRRDDPYAVYSSALSPLAVHTLLTGASTPRAVASSSVARSGSQAKATAALLRRVRVAYKADYALFAHLAAAHAAPFDATLYFPPNAPEGFVAASPRADGRRSSESSGSSNGSSSSKGSSEGSRSGDGKSNNGRRVQSLAEESQRATALSSAQRPRVGGQKDNRADASSRAGDTGVAGGVGAPSPSRAGGLWWDDRALDDDEVVLRVREPPPR